jgi:hypothetical protein
MRLTVLCSSKDSANLLANQADAAQIMGDTAPQGVKFEIESSAWTPGATGGWWEIIVDLGVVAAPVSILCNLIASWLWSAKSRTVAVPSSTDRPAPSERIRLILRDGDKVADVQIEQGDFEALRATIQAALIHVHSDQRIS